jgi:predicted DNA-binding transcriptional regulator AlpA
MPERDLSSDGHSQSGSGVGNDPPADPIPLDHSAARKPVPDESWGAAPPKESCSDCPLPSQVVPPVLDRKALAELLGVNQRSVDRWRKSGRLPAPFIIGTRNPRWLTKEIVKWLEAGAPSGR